MKNFKIPKGQKGWVVYKKERQIEYLVTSNLLRDKYFLYEIDSGGVLTKKATSAQPVFKELKYWEEY